MDVINKSPDVKARVLLIEDEAPIREMLGYALMKEGYDFDEAEDTDEAASIISERKPDLILLDWILPGTSGIDFLKRLKLNADTKSIPIMMLTAKGEITDKVRALDIGADDYITKPFSITELLARIRVSFRKNTEEEGVSIVVVEGLELNLDTHRVVAGDTHINLSFIEFHLLHHFVTHPEYVFSRTELLNIVWENNKDVYERTVDVHIMRLRKALTPHGFDKYIQTIRNVGYRFSTKGV